MAYTTRAWAYFEKVQYDDTKDWLTMGMDDCNKAIEINPNFPHAYSMRAWGYMLKHIYQLAIVDASKAIDLNPKFALAYTTRAWAYINLAQWDLAIVDCDKAI